jgi:hypothetical protein
MGTICFTNDSGLNYIPNKSIAASKPTAPIPWIIAKKSNILHVKRIAFDPEKNKNKKL